MKILVFDLFSSIKSLVYNVSNIWLLKSHILEDFIKKTVKCERLENNIDYLALLESVHELMDDCIEICIVNVSYKKIMPTGREVILLVKMLQKICN